MSKTPTRQTQMDLETVFSKYQLLEVLKNEFSAISEKHEPEEEQDFVNDVLVQIFLHKQADPVTMVGILSPKHGEPQEVADGLVAMCEMDYLDFDMNTKRFSLIYEITEDVQDMLDRYQYPMPMVVKPNEVTNNQETGYETIQGSVILNAGSGYFRDKDVCLDHLNRMNAVPLAFNFEAIQSPQGKFKKPVRKHGENFSDFSKRFRQAETFYLTSVSVMEGLNNLTDEIYLTHKFDRRGRTYASGYHVNTQGTPFHKAAVQLAKKELVK